MYGKVWYINMKKVIRLVSIQLWAVLGDMLSIGKNRTKKPKVIYAGVILFTLLMSGISFFYCFLIGYGLKEFNSLNILPTMMMAVTCVIILFTTVFKVKGTVFGFRDYDMVMSLPISTSGIVASRLIILYALNFMFVIIMMIPMMIAYGILANPDIRFYLYTSVGMLFIPLVPVVIASFLGTLIAYAASKFRYSNVLNIIFSVGLLAMLVTLSFTVNDNGQELVDMGKAMTNQINSIYPLAKMFADAVVAYDIRAFLLFILISMIAFMIFTILVKMVFKKLNTIMMNGRSRVNFKMGKLKTSSPMKALYFKELKRYFSSPLYVLNTGFGIVMLTIGAFALIFIDLNKVLGEAQVPVGELVKMVPLYVTFCIVMTCSAMASISLEGKNLWIIKSMPLSPKKVYLSKIAVNLTILLPAIIDSVIIAFAVKMDLLPGILLVLIAAACAVFISFYGLLINLLIPNFNWTTEVIVIKQSAACIITIFSSMAYVGVQFAFIMLIPSTVLAYLGYLLLTILVDVGLYLVIMNYGKRRYQEL